MSKEDETDVTAYEHMQVEIEKAVNNYVRERKGPGFIVTEWALVVNSVDMDNTEGSNSSFYMTPCSNLHLHAAKGLFLHAGDILKERNND